MSSVLWLVCTFYLVFLRFQAVVSTEATTLAYDICSLAPNPQSFDDCVAFFCEGFLGADATAAECYYFLCEGEDAQTIGTCYEELLGFEEPIFVDVNRTYFEFNGHKDGVFHVFSDQHMSMNSRFASANPAVWNESGTVMDVLAVQIAESFRVVVYSNSTTTFVNDTLLLPGKGLISGCVSVSIDKAGVVHIDTPLHALAINRRAQQTAHINTTFLDFDLKLAVDTTQVGGLLGLIKNISSAHKWAHEKLFLTSGLFATDAPTSHFHNTPLRCLSGGAPKLLVNRMQEAKQKVNHAHGAGKADGGKHARSEESSSIIAVGSLPKKLHERM